MIRLQLVHDTNLLRCALASLLAAERDIEVSASSWREVERPGTPAHSADAWLVDADCAGFAALTARDPVVAGGGAGHRGAAWSGAARPPREDGEGPAPGLVVLAPTGRPGLLHRAFAAGALGFVSKDARPARLLDAIRSVVRGSRYVDDALAFDFFSATHMPLTPRELNVLSLAADGAPVPEIAERLWLAEGTVRNYLAAIIRKTGARNRVDAIRISRGAGWV
ncbi:response regulator transcription factor [Streptomyces hainanensis]|uniref:Response regulator transcription factor n=1 Tax=Streptomyces hainanensis TaxID=402648 RepID=A0A4R4T3L2_9ACTN|nr:response regulator transcription factor [Streptomyces hainanensis]TDC69542.1 response regulator transcription factor [Streptomyces hainanensis]